MNIYFIFYNAEKFSRSPNNVKFGNSNKGIINNYR